MLLVITTNITDTKAQWFERRRNVHINLRENIAFHLSDWSMSMEYVSSCRHHHLKDDLSCTVTLAIMYTRVIKCHVGTLNLTAKKDKHWKYQIKWDGIAFRQGCVCVCVLAWHLSSEKSVVRQYDLFGENKVLLYTESCIKNENPSVNYYGVQVGA